MGPLVNLTDDVEVEDELEEDHQEQIEDEKTKKIPLVSDYFKSFKSYLKDNFDKKLEKWDIQKVGQVIDEFKQNAKNLMPDQTQIKQIKQSAEELGAVLKDRWDQLDFKEGKKKVDKLAKTVIKALNKAKDAVGEEFAPDKEIWSQRIFRIQEGFQTKWQKVMDKFAKKEEKESSEDRNNNSTCDKKSETKEKNKKKSEFKPDKKTKNKKNKQETVRTTEKKKNYTSWSSPSSKTENASWIFSRAKNRDESRKKTVKS